MNTIRSTWIGWGALAVAGGGAYFLAKRSIKADRDARHEADMKRRQLNESLEYNSRPLPRSTGNSHQNADHTGSSGTETSAVPRSSKNAPESTRKPPEDKGKYEASEPYRARKGDRFS